MSDRIETAKKLMTHEEVVARAAKWLRGTQRCGVVLTEFHSNSMEIPDAIGWRSGWSILVEAKTSVSDFYADAKKPGRTAETRDAGIGRLRYYMAPKGVLSPELVQRLRPGWGLAEVCGRRILTTLEAEDNGTCVFVNEAPLCYAYMRRIAQYGMSLDDAQEAVRKSAGLQGVK